MFGSNVPRTIVELLVPVAAILAAILVTQWAYDARAKYFNITRLKDLHLDCPMKVVSFYRLGTGILFAYYEFEGPQKVFIVNLGRGGRILHVHDVFRVVKSERGWRFVQLLERKRFGS